MSLAQKDNGDHALAIEITNAFPYKPPCDGRKNLEQIECFCGKLLCEIEDYDMPPVILS